MEQLNNNHQYTVIASINKIYNHAKIYGVLKPKELYILNVIYKLLNDCDECICYENKRKLISLYFKILNSSNLLCKQQNTKDYFFNNFNNFHVDVNNNTAPEIDNPTPIEPEDIIPPKTCGNSFIINLEIKVYNFTYEDLARTDCFVDQYGGIIKNIKILELPEYGVLTYNGENVLINQIIDLQNISDFKYTRILSGVDSFIYIIAGSTNPTVFNELDTVTLFIENE